MTLNPLHQKYQDQRAARLAQARITVRLASWSEADCIGAIDELIRHVEPGMADRAYENTLYAAFDIGGETVGEDVFFERVARDHSLCLAAMARLIDAYCDAFEHSHRHLYWSGDEGVGLFGHAVKALAAHGMAHMKTIRRYGLRLDRHHEIFFWNTTTPVMLEALGEASKETADFLIYVCLLQLYGSADMRLVWEKHLRKVAKANYTPEEFAHHSLDELARLEDQERIPTDNGEDPEGHGGAAFDYIARYVKADDWDRRVFAEWHRITESKAA